MLVTCAGHIQARRDSTGMCVIYVDAVSNAYALHLCDKNLEALQCSFG